MKNNNFKFNKFFNFEKENSNENRFSYVIISLFSFTYKIVSDTIEALYELFCIIIMNSHEIWEYFLNRVLTFYIYLTGFFLNALLDIYDHWFKESTEAIVEYPLFNFITFTLISLLYFGYFIDDAELMLFFSCTLVVLFVSFYVNKVVDSVLEEYSNSLILSLFEKFSIQIEAYVFEKEMYKRILILDDFLLYSVIFLENQLSEYIKLQANLFSYHYSKIVEANIISDGEEILNKSHFNALVSITELEKFVISYLILELVSEDYDIKNEDLGLLIFF